MKKNIKKNLRWILLIACLIVFFVILEDVLDKEINQFDSNIYKFISYGISNTVTIIAKVITTIGSAYVIIPVCIITAICLWKKKQGKYIIINLLIVFLSNQILKAFRHTRQGSIKTRHRYEDGMNHFAKFLAEAFKKQNLNKIEAYKYITNKHKRCQKVLVSHFIKVASKFNDILMIPLCNGKIDYEKNIHLFITYISMLKKLIIYFCILKKSTAF